MAVPREEVQAALEARRELGPAYEDEIVDALVAKIEQRLERSKPAEGKDKGFVPMLASLGVAIPLLGIAGATAGVPGVALVCLAVVLVNFFYYRASGTRR